MQTIICRLEKNKNNNLFTKLFLALVISIPILSVLILYIVFNTKDVSNFAFILDVVDYIQNLKPIYGQAVMMIGIILIIFLFLRPLAPFINSNLCELLVTPDGVSFATKSITGRKNNYITKDQIQDVELGSYLATSRSHSNKMQFIFSSIKNCYFLVRIKNARNLQFSISEDDHQILGDYLNKFAYHRVESRYDALRKADKNFRVTLTKNSYLYWIIVIVMLYLAYKFSAIRSPWPWQ